jgi:hypothetical protein
MNNILGKIPFEVIDAKLTAEDDRDLWLISLETLADEIMQKRHGESLPTNWVMCLGACSHWERPHQTRWTAAGGFAYPRGYKNSLPKFDWSVILIFKDGIWKASDKMPREKSRVFRIAVPSRTARHNQAAIHTRWIPGVDDVLYGFRKIDGRWKWVAASDESVKGIVRGEAD